MQKFYGFDSTIGVGRNFGFNTGEAMPTLEKPLITSINEDIDMAGGVRLEFAQFGDFDSFNVYRSSESMNENNLPQPIATGLTSMFFIDTGVEAGRTYYYRVAAIKSLDVSVSDEVIILVSGGTSLPHKWWRVTNIKVRNPAVSARSIADLRFINEEQIASDNPAKGFAKSNYNSQNSAAQAFDDNISTIAHNTDTQVDSALLYYIGYEFEIPVLVNAISIQMRQDMQPSFGHEWQSARVEYSDDNITWQRLGDINPKLAAMNLNKVVCDIDFSFKLPFRFWRISNIKDRSGGSSYIAAAELYFYDENDINLATDPLKAFSGANYSDASGVYTPDKAFDGDDSTFASGQVQGGWFIGYDFGSPEKVVKIGVKGRNDLPTGLKREWQTADIEVSEDGSSWKKIGEIKPMTPAEHIATVVSEIILT